MCRSTAYNSRSFVAEIQPDEKLYDLQGSMDTSQGVSQHLSGFAIDHPPGSVGQTLIMAVSVAGIFSDVL